MFKRTLPLAVVLLGLVMLSGCSSAPKLEKIGVQIKDLTPTPAGASLTLRFINPNNVALVVPSSEHTLYLDGTPMGSFQNRKPLGIPPLGTVAEPVAFSGETARAVGRFAARHPGSTAYTLESTLHLNWNDDLYDHKTRDQGYVTLKPAAVSP